MHCSCVLHPRSSVTSPGSLRPVLVGLVLTAFVLQAAFGLGCVNGFSVLPSAHKPATQHMAMHHASMPDGTDPHRSHHHDKRPYDNGCPVCSTIRQAVSAPDIPTAVANQSMTTIDATTAAAQHIASALDAGPQQIRAPPVSV